MATITLATHTISVRRKRSATLELLGGFDGSTSLHSVIDDFIADLKDEHAHDEEDQSLLRVRKMRTKTNLVYGTIEAGEYGYTTDLFDLDSGAESYRRGEEEAELYPFYFLFSVRDNEELGIMLFQRHGPRGVSTAVVKALRKWFNDRFPDFTLEIKRLVPAAVMRELMDSSLKAIEVTTYKIPSDITDTLSPLGTIKHVGKVTTRVEAQKDKYLSSKAWLKSINKGKSHLVAIPDPIDQIDGNVSVTLDYHGMERVVNFNRLEGLAPYIDCTHDVQLVGGHPTFKSMHKYALGLLDELEQQLRGVR